MKRLSDGINELFAKEAADGSVAAKARRAGIVRERWANAVRVVYGSDDAVDYILSHVNAVYIIEDELIVYADESLVRSDLDARQEFLKMALNSQGENVFKRFRIIASRFDMKARHPFVRQTAPKQEQQGSKRPPFPESKADEMVAHVENDALRAALKRAIMADLNK